MEANGPVWDAVLAQDLDPDTIVARTRDDGTDSLAPDRDPPRPGDPPRNGPPQPGLHGAHVAGDRAAGDRRLGLRRAGRPAVRGADPCLTGAGDDRRRLFRRGRRGHLRRLER